MEIGTEPGTESKFSEELDIVQNLLDQDKVEEAERKIKSLANGLDGSEMTTDLADRMVRLGADVETKKPRVGDVLEVERDTVAGYFKGYNSLVLGKLGEMGTFFMKVIGVLSDVEGVELPHLDDLLDQAEIVERYIRALPTAINRNEQAREVTEIRGRIDSIEKGLENYRDGIEKLSDRRKDQISEIIEDVSRLAQELDIFEKNTGKTLISFQTEKILKESLDLPNILRYVKENLNKEIDEATNSADCLNSSSVVRKKVQLYRAKLESFYSVFNGERSTKKELEAAIRELRKAEGKTTVFFKRIREKEFGADLIEMIDNYDNRVLGIEPAKQPTPQEAKEIVETSDREPPAILVNGDLYVATLNDRKIGCAIIVRSEKFDLAEGFEYHNESGTVRKIRAPVIRYVGLTEKADISKTLPVFVRKLSDYLLEQFQQVYSSDQNRVRVYYMIPVKSKTVSTPEERAAVNMWRRAGFRSTGKKYDVDEHFVEDGREGAYILRKGVLVSRI